MAWLKWCLPGSSSAKLQLSPFHSLFIGNESFSPVFTQEEENLVAHPGMRSIREFVGLCYKRQSNYRHTSPRLFFFFFTNWWFVPPCRGQLCGCHFPQQHLLSSCLCHILLILTICQMYLLYICYDDLRSGIFDVTVVTVLGHHKQHPYRTVILIVKYCVSSNCFNAQPLPASLNSPWALRHNCIEIGLFNSHMMAPKGSNERKY